MQATGPGTSHSATWLPGMAGVQGTNCPIHPCGGSKALSELELMEPQRQLEEQLRVMGR